MSNEYKDWLWDTIQELIFDNDLADKITAIYPIPDKNDPYYVECLKDLQIMKYYIYIDTEGNWTYKKVE